MTEIENVDDLIQELTHNLEEAYQQHKSREYSETEIDEIVGLILEGFGDDPNALLADPTRLLNYSSLVGNVALKGWKQKMRYHSFHLTPRIAKLSFEDYNLFCDVQEQLVMEKSAALAEVMNKRITPVLLDRMMDSLGPMGAMLGPLMGGGDGFLSGLDDWKKDGQDGDNPLTNIFEEFLKPFTDPSSKDEESKDETDA